MKKIKMRHVSALISFCITLVLISCFNQVSAQDSTKVKKWHFLAEPYLMFPYMNGETGIGESLVLPVDATAGDIFSKLQMGAMIYLEAKTDKWAVTSDLVYMNLTQDVTPGIILHEGSVEAKQLIWEAAGFYRLTSFLEVGVGGRVNYLQTSVDAQGKCNTCRYRRDFRAVTIKHGSILLLLARMATDIKDKWLFQFRGDVGGFSVGSKLTWQLQGYAGYRFSKLFQLTAGYRILSTDYKNGEEPKEFVFNVDEFGPVVRFGFNF